jgi:hypothetical protein
LITKVSPRQNRLKRRQNTIVRVRMWEALSERRPGEVLREQGVHLEARSPSGGRLPLCQFIFILLS